MAKLTRKSLLKKTSTGAVMVGALAAVPGAAAAAAARPEAGRLGTQMAGIGPAEPFVVYVHNPRAGELVLMVGGEEITYHDPALVARLWQASRRASHRLDKSGVR